jgi:hypothetical protein
MIDRSVSWILRLSLDVFQGTAEEDEESVHKKLLLLFMAIMLSPLIYDQNDANLHVPQQNLET